MRHYSSLLYNAHAVPFTNSKCNTVHEWYASDFAESVKGMTPKPSRTGQHDDPAAISPSTNAVARAQYKDKVENIHLYFAQPPNETFSTVLGLPSALDRASHSLQGAELDL